MVISVNGGGGDPEMSKTRKKIKIKK